MQKNYNIVKTWAHYGSGKMVKLLALISAKFCPILKIIVLYESYDDGIKV